MESSSGKHQLQIAVKVLKSAILFMHSSGFSVLVIINVLETTLFRQSIVPS